MSANNEETFNELINYGDIIAVIRTVYGKNVKLINYVSKRATSSVQGFTSLMIRVTTLLELNNKQNIEFKFVIKRLPTLQSQIELMSEANPYEREVDFFNKVVPLLSSEESLLPLPKCYLAYDSTLIMEDLCVNGYKTLFEDVRKAIEKDMDLSYIRLIMRNLAKFHASSLNKNWQDIMKKHLDKDMMETDMFTKLTINWCNIFAAVLKEYNPNIDKKYLNFLQPDNIHKIMCEYAKPVKDKLNVLCHGDCWANNMMFKFDQNTNELIDMKFIDLQIIRYSKPNRDIFYFLYLNTTQKYRDIYEDEILKTYVNAFNTYACKTPDLLNYDDFKKDFNNDRLFGQIFEFLFKPMMAMDDIFPDEMQDKLSNDQVDKLFKNDNTISALNQFRTNTKYRNFIIDIIHNTINTLDNLKLV